MAYFTALHGYWLWYVWAVIAVFVVLGYIRVRRQIDRADRSAESGDEQLKQRHAAEHEKRKHKGVE